MRLRKMPNKLSNIYNSGAYSRENNNIYKALPFLTGGLGALIAGRKGIEQ